MTNMVEMSIWYFDMDKYECLTGLQKLKLPTFSICICALIVLKDVQCQATIIS